MDRLSSEILLSIFKRLTSLQMVLVMRVCREWLEIIDENRSLWRELILPKGKQDPWLKSLELFGRKSDSTLTQVSMNVKEVREKATLIEILRKSKATLQALNLTGTTFDTNFRMDLEEELLDYPKLVDRRVYTPAWQTVQLRLSKRRKEFGVQDDHGSSLRVLWTFTPRKLFDSHLHLLDRLVSLSVFESCDSSRWRGILEGSSQSLKHLEITLRDHSNPQSVSALNFPKLKVLDLNSLHPFRHFPTWFRPSSSATLITRRSFFSSLPSCSKLWILDFHNVAELQAKCPELSELRIVHRHLNQADWSAFVSMLRRRKSNAEAGTEIDGAKMIPLKTLVLPFRLVKDELLSLLRELVEEVVDLDSVSRFIELEV